MKRTQIDKAIAELEGEQRVLQLAIEKLRQAQARRAPRPRTPKQSAEVTR